MTVLIGRQIEAAKVASLLSLLPHAGGALVLRGEAGIGKTAITTLAIERAVAQGTTTMYAIATEFESTLPYAALQQLLHPFAHQIVSSRDRPREVLAQAFGQKRGEAPGIFAVAVATLEILIDIAGNAGLLLVVDDAHWVDESTARVLAFVARRIASDPIVALLVVRSGVPSSLNEAGLDTLELERLDQNASRELLENQRAGLSVEATQRVLRFADGNPLALLELPESFDIDTQHSTLDGRLRAAFRARFAAVSVLAARMLLLAAVEDGDDTREVISAASGIGADDRDAMDALRELHESGALRIDGQRFEFRHPLIRSAIISFASPQELSEAHAALARVITANSDRVAWHSAAAGSGPDEAIAAALAGIAERATQRGNLAVSLQAMELSARVTESATLRSIRLMHGAETAIELGRRDRAIALVAQVQPEALSKQGAARFALLQREADPQVLSAEGLRTLVRHAHAALDADEVDLAIDLTLVVGESLDAGGFETEAEAIAIAARIAATLEHSDPRRLVVQSAVDPVPYTEELTAAMLALDATELNHRSEMLVRVRFMVDANPAVARMQERLLDGYRANGKLRSIAFLQPLHSWNQIALGNWPEALRAAEEGTRLAQDLNLPRWGTGTLIAEAFVAAVRGDHAAADARIREAERGATLLGAHNVLTGVQLTKGVNYIAQGHYDQALDAFRRCLDPADPSYHALQSGWVLGDLAEAAAHTGRADDVRYLYLRDKSQPTTQWQAMAEQYAMPFLAVDDDDIERGFLSALRGRVSAWPSYRARLLLEYGSWLRRQRRITEAKDRLRAARELADALAMLPWANRARDELRAAGEESALRRSSAWEALSAQELQVIQLAAQGLSNREIGERLFLSHRTVGSHLYHIFPKLGVTSRAQLSRALATLGE